ncbi:protein of unknown function [Beijerinckiaceae bacterium RH AL1]|nr:protein of unknown function [Beijerinckiaceae bacterium RH CH11]VVB49812.1 protein of unknown function [Beijerinckiaceae bacterium RH AL8]VVC57050.1 protein of unknown function [Beijerinckiaceae bacterium RH AL1]
MDIGQLVIGLAGMLLGAVCVVAALRARSPGSHA